MASTQGLQTRRRVLFCFPPTAMGGLGEALGSALPPGWEVESFQDPDDEAERRERLARADYLIPSRSMPLTDAVLDVATNLRLVHQSGVGLDGVNLDGMRDRDIVMCICPEATTDTVAEHTIALMLASCRHLVNMSNEVTHHHRWPKFDYRSRSASLNRARVVLLGFGRIARAVANRLAPFGPDLVVFRRSIPTSPVDDVPSGIRYTDDLSTALSGAEVVSVHLSLNEETHHLIGAEQLALTRRGAILVNTSRGAVIDEQAVIAALKVGQLGGVGLDVLEKEPPDWDSELLTLDNVIISPHTASGTSSGVKRKVKAIAENLVRFDRGEEPLNRVV